MCIALFSNTELNVPVVENADIKKRYKLSSYCDINKLKLTSLYPLSKIEMCKYK